MTLNMFQDPIEAKDIPLNMVCDNEDLVLDKDQILTHSRCSKLEHVTILRVPSCNFTKINTEDLIQCFNLKELDISSNLFTEFPSELNFPQLKVLDLSGNMFEAQPLIEQFPALLILNIEQRFEVNLNFSAVTHFCPHLKFINGQYFEPQPCEIFENRIFGATKALETIIKTKWRSDFEHLCADVFNNKERIFLINELVNQLKDLNLLLDDKLNRYKSTLIFQITEDYLKAKLNDPDDELLGDGVANPNHLIAYYGTNNAEEDSKILQTIVDINKEALDKLELLCEEYKGTNVQHVVKNTLVMIDDHEGQPQQCIIQESQPMFHVGQAAAQNRTVVMTVFKPDQVKGKPNVDFLPGELRNKDYVKGYMASDIYQKAVKDTLGQKNLTKSNPITSFVPMSLNGPRKRGRPPKSLLSSGLDEPEKNPKNNFSVNDSINRIPMRPIMKIKAGDVRSLKDVDTSGNVAKLDYDPINFIICHKPSDRTTKVWRCAFEPDPYNPDRTTNIVATCGGNSVCIIDCETGKILKDYCRANEDFMALAWSTLDKDTDQRFNIIAAAGKLKDIRLYFKDSEMYCDLNGHQEDVSSLLFHPTSTNYLFSGDTKASIFIWEIITPGSSHNNLLKYQLLMQLKCPRLDINAVLNLVYLDHYNYLIAGCEDGIFAWKITEFRHGKLQREPDMELKLMDNIKLDVSADNISYDGLAQVSPTALVFKIVKNPRLLVFDFGTTLERRKGLQKVVPIEVSGQLDWQMTEDFYINVTARCNLRAIMCGDSSGNIWLYDIDPYIEDTVEKLSRGFTCQPLKIIEWPQCGDPSGAETEEVNKLPIINTVDMSSSGKYIVAVTDNNLVCIWGLTKE